LRGEAGSQRGGQRRDGRHQSNTLRESGGSEFLRNFPVRLRKEYCDGTSGEK
jgi:hypothetical protein